MSIVARLQNVLNTQAISAYCLPHAYAFLTPRSGKDATQRIERFTGFTGSAGTLVIQPEHVGLWVDSRYPIQARTQVKQYAKTTGSPPIQVYETASESPWAWMERTLEQGSVLALDAWLYTVEERNRYADLATQKGWILVWNDEILADTLWQDKFPNTNPNVHPEGRVWSLEYDAGIFLQNPIPTVQEKCHAVFTPLLKDGQKALLANPVDIAWLLNLRGDYVPTVPSVYGYALVHHGTEGFKADVFLPAGTAPSERIPDITFHPLDALWEALKNGDEILYEPDQMPSGLFHGYPQISWQESQFHLDKARSVKTPAEVRNMEEAHLWDGVALVRFLHWLSMRPSGSETELSASHRLNAFRHQNPAYRGPSFPTISAFGTNSAVIHYVPCDTTNSVLEEGLYLVDSGGQYWGSSVLGTTDVTRTLWLGPDAPPTLYRERFTCVLQAHIHLYTLKFPSGTRGVQLDAAARSFLWQGGYDYPHSTGHGVGVYLSVHESIPKITPREDHIPLEPGMIVSNEPGYYQEAWGGIRLENVVSIVSADETPPEKASTHFEKATLRLQALTLAPFHKALIEGDALSAQHRQWLNAYHQTVYAKLSPHLDDAPRQWLLEATQCL